MPSTCCSVPGCSNRGGHEFPADIDRRKDWVIAIRRDNGKGGLWEPTKWSVVCQAHFKAEDYKTVTAFGKCDPDVLWNLG